ncbi:T9SS type A sorting domain-containing protein [Psychroserpens ponticola]|uniref:T9SS type A sorting domain-containing protein n=1 Tax=Psychroserpens ponticola TaxID=2932268 RepID=A0ABY7RT31_9FLAO|nr:T9SS type A sorting domain-containing protein [Psychroserpens ponticola]WCO00265.1 T9SS type A sorting domain-containing protein [Psychroserpens ponticola]
MKKILLTLVIFQLTFSIKSYSQEWTWSIKATGDDQRYNALDMDVDIDGNMVVAGYYQENFSLGSFSLYTEDDYYADIYLARINSEKEVEWLINIEAEDSYGDDISITTDDDDNIYLTGNKDGKIFVTKYNSEGIEIWTNNFDNQYYGYGKSIALDQYDNVYISGGSGWNFFMAKLDFFGETIWVKDLWHNSSNACDVTDIDVDKLGNIYFIGVFDIDELILDSFTLEHNGSWGDDTFWGKMDTDGNFIWIKSSDGRTNSNPQIALTSNNYLYLSGSLYSGITFESVYIDGICCQNPKPYIVKYDTTGNLIWAKEAHTTLEEKGVPADIKVDYSGNMYLTGSYYSSSTNTNSYLEKYDVNGLNQWRQEFVMYTADYSEAIDIDNNGFCYYTGYNNSINFIDETQSVTENTFGIAQLNTLSSTYKKTERPKINRNYLLCENNTQISLTATGDNIKWYSDSDITNEIHLGNNYNFQVTENNILYVTQTINNIESWPKQIIIEVSELPNAELTYDNQILSATYNENFNYEWYYQSTIISGETNNSIMVEETTEFTDYSVIINHEDCSIELSAQVLSITDTDFQNPLSLNIYPNPTNSFIYIKNSNINAFDVKEIRIYNTLGKTVYRRKVNLSSKIGAIDLSQLEIGIYFINIKHDETSKTFRVIKK